MTLQERIDEAAQALRARPVPEPPSIDDIRRRRRDRHRLVTTTIVVASVLVFGGLVATYALRMGAGQRLHVGGAPTTGTTTTSAGFPSGLPPDGAALTDFTQLTSLSFVSSRLGYGVLTERSPTLARTDDGGRTWHLIGSLSLGQEAFARITFASPTVGYAWSLTAGASPLAVTNDGGATWNTKAVGGGVLDLTARGASAYAVTGCGDPNGNCDQTLWATADSGATWRQLADLHFVGSSAAVSIDADGAVYLASTVPHPHPGASVPGVQIGVYRDAAFAALGDPCQAEGIQVQLVAAAQGKIWLACAAGITGAKLVYLSADAGGHWSLAASVGYGQAMGSIPATDSLWELLAVDGSHAFVNNFNGGVLATGDGGRTWRPVLSVPAAPVRTVALLPGAEELWAVTATGANARLPAAVWHTNDGRIWNKLAG